MTTNDRSHRPARIGVATLLSLGSLALAPAPAAQADPPGNNGTVKIAPLGEIDRIPENTPHVGCSFEVEWYGFDAGPDIVSTVGFEEQAPTTDVGMTVSGPAQVFVGGDDASGAGTPTGLDGREVYTLAFTGAPHPQQGYHVKLTIHTPGSIGNDSKTKVFWVEGCAPVTPPTPTPPPTPETPTPPTPPTPETPTPPTPPTPETPTPPTPATPEVPTTPNTPTTPETPEVLPETEQTPEVLGVQAFANGNGNGGAETQQQAQQELPTAVNAGAAGEAAPTGVSMTESLLGLLLVLLGAVTARWGWIRTRG